MFVLWGARGMRKGMMTVDAGSSPFPSFRGRRPWNPPVRGTRPTVDAGGLPSPPSSSRSARMTAELEKARRYRGRTNGGILRSLALPLNDVQGLRCGAWGAAVTWTRGLKVSVIQRPKAVESPGQGHMPNSRRGRAALSSVILAKRGSPGQGRGGTLSLPCWNQR